MNRALYKVTKVKLNGKLIECRIYKARRLFRYYRRYKWVYTEEEE